MMRGAIEVTPSNVRGECNIPMRRVQQSIWEGDVIKTSHHILVSETLILSRFTSLFKHIFNHCTYWECDKEEEGCNPAKGAEQGHSKPCTGFMSPHCKRVEGWEDERVSGWELWNHHVALTFLPTPQYLTLAPPPSLGIPVMSSIEVVRGVIASRLALER